MKLVWVLEKLFGSSRRGEELWPIEASCRDGETSVLKSTVSQQVERTETKGGSQRVEVDATPSSSGGSASDDTSSEVTPGGAHDNKRDAEQMDDIVEDVELFAAIGTKVKPRSWLKKHGSQACDIDKLKLKAVVLHDGREEVHMTQSDRFAAADTGTIIGA